MKKKLHEFLFSIIQKNFFGPFYQVFKSLISEECSIWFVFYYLYFEKKYLIFLDQKYLDWWREKNVYISIRSKLSLPGAMAKIVMGWKHLLVLSTSVQLLSECWLLTRDVCPITDPKLNFGPWSSMPGTANSSLLFSITCIA